MDGCLVAEQALRDEQGHDEWRLAERSRRNFMPTRCVAWGFKLASRINPEANHSEPPEGEIETI